MDAFTVGVITPNAKLVFAANPNTLVQDLKEEALYKSNCCCGGDAVLTFCGRVLKDCQTLRQENVMNGHNVYLSMCEKPQAKSVQKYFKKTNSCMPIEDYVQMQKYICDQFTCNPHLIKEFLNLLCKIFSKSCPTERMLDTIQSTAKNKCLLQDKSPMTNLIRAFSEQLNHLDEIYPRCKTNHPRTKSLTGSTCSFGANVIKEVLNEKAMQDLIQQMSENPTLLQDFMSSPQVQEMMRDLSRNFNCAFDGYRDRTSFCDSESFQKYAGCLLNLMKQCNKPINPPSYQELQREKKCPARTQRHIKHLDSKLKRLTKMGYTNCKKNVAALHEANGYLPCAINILDNYYSTIKTK